MNQIVKSGQVWSPPAVGARDGNWVWDGTNWVCDPDCGQPPCPPPFGPPVFSGPTQQPPWYPGANGGVTFGQFPPANPVRGHFWWDGTALHMFDGAAWVQVGGAGASGGAATGTTPPANPFPGQQWFNGSTLFVWDGTAWVPVAGTKSYVQPTPPSAPNPGDTWWDGTVMRIWDGSAWEVVGPGGTGPVPTSAFTFSIPQPVNITGLSTSAAAFSILAFTGTPLVDSQGAYDPVTHKVTPKKSGVYMCSARFACFSGGGIAIVKNDGGIFNGSGSVTTDLVVAIASESAGGWLQAEGIVPLNGSTDFVRLFAWAVDGTWHNAGNNPAFTLAVFA